MKCEKYIPLFNILRELEPVQRIIILSHLDEQTCESIYACINTLLITDLRKIKKYKSSFPKIKKILSKQKKNLRFLAKKNKSKYSKRQKKKILPQIGGSLGLVMSIVIPIILDLISKK